MTSPQKSVCNLFGIDFPMNPVFLVQKDDVPFLPPSLIPAPPPPPCLLRSHSGAVLWFHRVQGSGLKDGQRSSGRLRPECLFRNTPTGQNKRSSQDTANLDNPEVKSAQPLFLQCRTLFEFACSEAVRRLRMEVSGEWKL